MVCSFPITLGENDSNDSNGNTMDANDMTLVESSPSRSNILVHNSFHLPMDQTFHIPPMDQMRSPEMTEDSQFTVN